MSSSERWLAFGLALVAAVLIGGCGADQPTASSDETTASGGDAAPSSDETTASGADAEPSSGELFPDVVAGTARRAGDGTWEFSATLSSPYDSPERYADAWRVVGPDGSVLGVRELAHDHAAEQPFTRSLSGVIVADDIDEVVIEGRDQISGWGGRTATVTLERS